MLWETSYKDPASKQDLNPPREPHRGRSHFCPWAASSLGTSGCSLRPWDLGSRVSSNHRAESSSWSRYRTVDKRDQHTQAFALEELTPVCLPVWSYQDPLCLADAGVLTTRPSPGEWMCSQRQAIRLYWLLWSPAVPATVNRETLGVEQMASLGVLPSHRPDLHLLRIILAQHISCLWNWAELSHTIRARARRDSVSYFPAAKGPAPQDSSGWFWKRWSLCRFHHREGLPCLVSHLIFT